MKKTKHDHDLFFPYHIYCESKCCNHDKCGFSVYRNTMIVWDEDHDLRVMSFIDELPKVLRKNLVAVHEHKGSLALVWSLFIPKGYEEEKHIEVKGVLLEDCDSWYIYKSTVCCKNFVI